MSKLVQRIGLEKSAVQHLANTLQMDGMRDMTPHRHRFRPSHAWLQMASAFFCFNLLVRLAMPKLVELSHRLDGTVNLVELSGDHIMYVSRVPGRRGQFAASLVGRRPSALGENAGRAILSRMSLDKRVPLIDRWTLMQMPPQTC